MKELDELIDKTDVGIIMSDYMGSQWNGNMRDDIVDMVNTKYKALIATQIQEARRDELEKFVQDMNAIRVDDGFVPIEYTYIKKRIAQLRSTPNE